MFRFLDMHSLTHKLPFHPRPPQSQHEPVDFSAADNSLFGWEQRARQRISAAGNAVKHALGQGGK